LVGEEIDHYLFLLDKSNNMAHITKSSILNRQQARLAYSSCYIPALVYSFSAVSLTMEQINKIQQKANCEYLVKSGYDMHFPRIVVYGSTKFGGLAFNQLYVESSINKIQSLMCHINSDTMLGKMIKINLMWIQLLTGLSKPIMKSRSSIDCIGKNWFTQLCEFLM
jgi:hypothetical protein